MPALDAITDYDVVGKTDNIISGTMPADMHPKDLFLRIDHQTFRKLPKTRGIMFGVWVSCRFTQLDTVYLAIPTQTSRPEAHR